MLDAPIQERVVEGPHPCHKCGYELAGLPLDSRCPECGFSIRKKRIAERYVDNLTDAPMAYLNRLQVCLAGLTLAVFLFLGGLGVVVFGVPAAVTVEPVWVLLGVFGTAGVVWSAGAWFIAARRPLSDTTSRDVVLDSPTVRASIRATQPWAAGSVALAFVGQALLPGSTGGDAAMVLAGVGVLVTFFGLIPFSIYLSSIADWAGDGPLGERFRSAAWGVAVFGTLAVGAEPQSGIFHLLGIFAKGLVAFSLVWLLVSVVQLGSLASWARQNHVTGEARDERVLERERQELEAREAKIAERLARLEATPDPVDPTEHAEDVELTPGEPIPLIESDEDDVEDLEPVAGATEPLRPVSKVHFKTPALPPITGKKSKAAPETPPSVLPDMGEEHYTEHRYFKRGKDAPDPHEDPGL